MGQPRYRSMCFQGCRRSLAAGDTGFGSGADSAGDGMELEVMEYPKKIVTELRYFRRDVKPLNEGTKVPYPHSPSRKIWRLTSHPTQPAQNRRAPPSQIAQKPAQSGSPVSGDPVRAQVTEKQIPLQKPEFLNIMRSSRRSSRRAHSGWCFLSAVDIGPTREPISGSCDHDGGLPQSGAVGKDFSAARATTVTLHWASQQRRLNLNMRRKELRL